MPVLVIFGGLPATGKTAVSRELARQIGAMHLRIDSIEQAMRNCGLVDPPLDETGYSVAYAIAEDNLRLGRTVIADSVNPLTITRDAWMEVANRAGVPGIEVEVQCSDAKEHRRRVETRTADVPGLKLPSWQQVLSREYHAWNRDRIVIDTGLLSIEEAVAKLRDLVQSATPYIEVVMERTTLEGLPPEAKNPSLTIREYQAGDEVAWTHIQTEADRYNTITRELFVSEFGQDPSQRIRRILFAEAANGELVGTSTAWWGASPQDEWGRAHWVAVFPKWQHKGIGRALLVATLHRLRDLGHTKAFLTTSAVRVQAVRLYSSVGFSTRKNSEKSVTNLVS